MNRSARLGIGLLAAFVGGTAIGISTSTSADTSAAPSPVSQQVGRYRAVTSFRTAGSLMLIDTATGECWKASYDSKEWEFAMQAPRRPNQ
jgi:hypothetical protein